MRKVTYYSGGKSDNIGCGIFYLMLIFLPIIGWIFNALDWIIEHLGWILVILSIIGVAIAFIKDDKREQEIQEEEEEV